MLPPGKARAISQPAGESHYVLTYIRDYLVKEESRKYDKQVQECRETLLNLFGRLVKISGPRDRVGVFPMILGAIELLSLLVAPTT